MNAPVIKFNGTLVKMYAQCLSDNSRMDFPQSYAGNDYVINQFKVKNEVIIEQGGYAFTFSAKGFQRAYNKEVQDSIDEQNAL